MCFIDLKNQLGQPPPSHCLTGSLFCHPNSMKFNYRFTLKLLVRGAYSIQCQLTAKLHTDEFSSLFCSGGIQNLERLHCAATRLVPGLKGWRIKASQITFDYSLYQAGECEIMPQPVTGKIAKLRAL